MTIFQTDGDAFDSGAFDIDPVVAVRRDPSKSAAGELVESATTQLVTRMTERLEQELLAAWRMDYDFVYVCHHLGVDDVGGDQTFGYSMSVQPSVHRQPPDMRKSAMDTLIQYDLRDVTRAEIQAARRLADRC